jgi:hypothetical protein
MTATPILTEAAKRARAALIARKLREIKRGIETIELARLNRIFAAQNRKP